MTKEEVAELLGCSTRQVERYTSANRLGVRYEKGTTRQTPVYDRAQVEAFKAELETPTFKPSLAAPTNAPQTAIATRGDIDPSQLSEMVVITAEKLYQANLDRVSDAFSQIAEAIQRLRETPSSVPIADKVMLTLQDAAALSSLSRGSLLEAIHAGKLKAKIIGRGWRVKRTDLDAYVKKL